MQPFDPKGEEKISMEGTPVLREDNRGRLRVRGRRVENIKWYGGGNFRPQNKKHCF